MVYGIKDVIKDELQGKATHVSRDVKQSRLSTCTICPHFKRLSRQCGICGCFLDAKTLYANSECPDNPPRWSSI